MSLLVVIPARGGSKGVPRKNLRLVGGKPLVIRACEMAERLLAFVKPDLGSIVVSTEDREIAAVVRTHGFRVIDRAPELATDEATVGDVARDVAMELDAADVLILQPTCAALTPESLAQAYAQWKVVGDESLTVTTPLRHRAYGNHGDAGYIALHHGDVNRQTAVTWGHAPIGAFFVKSQVLTRNDPAMWEPCGVFDVGEEEALDIDTHEDLEAARRRALGRKLIRVHVAAAPEKGTGHLRRGLLLAEELSHHDVEVVPVDYHSDWIHDQIVSRGFERKPEFAGMCSDVVIFDCLDTDERDVASAKSGGALVVTIEDQSSGSRHADLVVNDMYGDGAGDVVRGGPRWAVLGPEFVGLPLRQIYEHPARVLVTFGGSDPAGLTQRVIEAIGVTPRGFAAVHSRSDVRLRVVVPPAPGTGRRLAVVETGADDQGWALLDAAEKVGVEFVREPSMAEELLGADLVVTSCGRTIYEAAACGTPVIAIAVNAREATHVHAGSFAGVINLGLHATVSDEHIRDVVKRLLGSVDLRRELSERLQRNAPDGLGARRIARWIEDRLEGL